MQEIRKNERIVTREQAYEIVNNDWAITKEELNRFSKRFNKNKQIIVCRQIGLGDSLIERKGRKYFVYDIEIH